MRHTRIASCFILALSTAPTGAADQGLDILNLPLERLAQLEVVSASRRPESLPATAAAVAVLTRDDIRRSGAQSLPDALRLVPGVEVMRLDADKWAVGIRGFTSRTTNKLLVLVDGRSVYDPLFSGVFWETLEMPIALIERIEVVRGPGGTQWGANAVNGVINIITRRAGDLPASGANLGAGTLERSVASAHVAGELGTTALVGYAKHIERGPSRDPGQPQDRLGLNMGGVRGDRSAFGGDLMFKLESFDADVGDPSGVVVVERGTNLTMNWNAVADSGVQRWLLAYFDQSHFDNPLLEQDRRNANLEYRETRPNDDGGSFSWGLGYRNTVDDVDGSPFILMRQRERHDRFLIAFLERQLRLSAANQLTLGLKLEDNTYTGLELSPTLRFAHDHASGAFSWTALSRAVRVPSRLEADITAPLIGDPDLKAEVLVAAEVGHRRSLSTRWFLDVAAFVQDYSRIVSSEGLSFANLIEGRSQGVETALHWKRDDMLRAELALSLLDLEVAPAPGGTDTGSSAFYEDNAARHRLSLRLVWDPNPRWSHDIVLRSTGNWPWSAATCSMARTTSRARRPARCSSRRPCCN
jgi:iron complex outermembrane receptor protein